MTKKNNKKKYKVSDNFSGRDKKVINNRKKLAERLGEELFQLTDDLTR